MLPFKDRCSFATDTERNDWDEGYDHAVNGVDFDDEYATDAYAAGYDAGLYDLRGDK